MLSTVLRIFKSCPKLVQINLRWAREKCLNHLKQEGVYDVIEWEEAEDDCRDGKQRRKAMTEGVGRLPRTLMVSERGIPLIGKPFSRRYKYTLPVGKKRGLVVLGGGKGSSSRYWRWGGKRRVVDGGVDIDEGEVAVGTSPVIEENESVESAIEEVDSEVEDERVGGDDQEEEEEEEEEEEISVSTSVKGKELDYQRQLPTERFVSSFLLLFLTSDWVVSSCPCFDTQIF